MGCRERWTHRFDVIYESASAGGDSAVLQIPRGFVRTFRPYVADNFTKFRYFGFNILKNIKFIGSDNVFVRYAE